MTRSVVNAIFFFIIFHNRVLYILYSLHWNVTISITHELDKFCRLQKNLLHSKIAKAQYFDNENIIRNGREIVVSFRKSVVKFPREFEKSYNSLSPRMNRVINATGVYRIFIRRDLTLVLIFRPSFMDGLPL